MDGRRSTRLRYRWLMSALVLALVASTVAVYADVIVIDPSQPPVVTLPPAEAQKLQTIESAFYPPVFSETSPDDSMVFSASPVAPGYYALLNVRTGTFTSVDQSIANYTLITEARWQDQQTLVIIAQDTNSNLVRLAIDRATGAVTPTPLTLPGYPTSLAPDGQHLLVTVAPTTSSARGLYSPFDVALSQAVGLTTAHRSWPAHGSRLIGGQDHAQPLRLTSTQTRLVVVDLASQAQTMLVTLPTGTGLIAWRWTRDSRSLALVRTATGNDYQPLPLSDLLVQEALGHIPPAVNPFLQENVVDTFDFATHIFRIALLRAATGNGDIFTDVNWSNDGSTLLAKMFVPAHLRGRLYPSYLPQPERAYYRFYSPTGVLRTTLDRPEIDAAPYPFISLPLFISPTELVISAVDGLSQGLFYYNLTTAAFRRLPAPIGTIYFDIVATRHSREVVFNLGSVTNPGEVYRIGVDDPAARQVTQVNAAVRAANHVRVDHVSFTLANGGRRVGFLVQPAGAAFPPQLVPMLLWQTGGPGGTMTDDWGGYIEQPWSLLPNFGLPVLVVSLAGRLGFDASFQNALYDDRNFGQIDEAEQAEIVGQIEARGWTAPDRVGAIGQSYGGYFVSQSLTRYPNDYAAASIQSPLLDISYQWQYGATPFWSFVEGRTPINDPTEYVRDTPLNHAKQVRSPLLVLDGTNNFLPTITSRDFYDAVAATGTPARYMLFQGETHNFQYPNSQFIAAQAQIEWFRQYLKGTRPTGRLPEAH